MFSSIDHQTVRECLKNCECPFPLINRRMNKEQEQKTIIIVSYFLSYCRSFHFHSPYFHLHVFFNMACICLTVCSYIKIQNGVLDFGSLLDNCLAENLLFDLHLSLLLQVEKVITKYFTLFNQSLSPVPLTTVYCMFLLWYLQLRKGGGNICKKPLEAGLWSSESRVNETNISANGKINCP